MANFWRANIAISKSWCGIGREIRFLANHRDLSALPSCDWPRALILLLEGILDSYPLFTRGHSKAISQLVEDLGFWPIAYQPCPLVIGGGLIPDFWSVFFFPFTRGQSKAISKSCSGIGREFRFLTNRLSALPSCDWLIPDFCRVFFTFFFLKRAKHSNQPILAWDWSRI